MSSQSSTDGREFSVETIASVIADTPVEDPDSFKALFACVMDEDPIKFWGCAHALVYSVHPTVVRWLIHLYPELEKLKKWRPGTDPAAFIASLNLRPTYRVTPKPLGE